MWEINKIIENDLLTHIISRPRILLGGDHPISKIDLNWWPAESGLIIKQLCLMCADVQRIKRRDVTELFSSCCRLVWFKLAHSLFYPKHNPSTFLNAHPSPLCVAERGLMLLTGSGEKQAAGPRFCNQSSSGVYALGCLAIYSGLSTQRERAALKMTKNARNLLSRRRRQRDTKGASLRECCCDYAMHGVFHMCRRWWWVSSSLYCAHRASWSLQLCWRGAIYICILEFAPNSCFGSRRREARENS